MTAERFSVYGFRFSIRTDLADARDAIFRLYRQFRDLSATDEGADAALECSNDGLQWRLGEKTAAASDLRSALWGLESAICEAIIRSQQRMIAIHAATLYWGSSAVLLVAPSGAGKSTLTMALGRRGLTVATDDVAFVDPETLDVFPIPRCFHLDQTSVRLLKEAGVEFPEVWKRLSFMTPNDLDQNSMPRSKARLLIYLVRSRSERPHFAAVSQAEMTARLLSETGQGPLTDSETVRVLQRVAGSAACFTLVPGPLALTADAVADVIARHCPNSIAAFAAAG